MLINKNFKVKKGLEVTDQIISSLVTGTAPLVITSTTLVTNLNADLLDGNQASAFALISGKLSQFSATTSLELKGVISDETGSGALVFATSPTLVTPVLGVATGTSFNSITGLASVAALANGTAAVGTSTLAARQDHVHPVDTSRAAFNQTMYIGTTAVAINRISAALTLTGTSIDGNASTVTNGVYTSGSYSDPSWLTISKSKVGLSNVENTTLSTWGGSLNLATAGNLSATSLTAGNFRVRVHTFQNKAFTAGSWYRFITFPSTNVGQEATIILRNPAGHDSVEIVFSKHTPGNSGLGYIAEIKRKGSYAYTYNITKIRVCDDGVNAASHLEVQFGANHSSILNMSYYGLLPTDLTVSEFTSGATGESTTKELFVSTGVNGTNNQTVHGYSTSGLDLFYINGSGNVLIGTYTDDNTAKLQVSGIVKATSFTGNLTGNATTATTLIGDQTNWANYRSAAVANMLGWKNYGNSHVIFDASDGTSPTGSEVNSTNPSAAWSVPYPTLMGWNGRQTYGVRVDSARYADYVGGLAIHTGRNNEANKLVRTDAGGYIQCGFINCNNGIENPSISVIVTGNGDGYYRYSSLAHLGNSLAIPFANVTSLSAYLNQAVLTTSRPIFGAGTNSNFTINDGTNNLEVRSLNSSGCANIVFNRTGAFAAKFGLNLSSQFEWGGYSMSPGRMYLDSSGNLTAAGNITAYSDIRLKSNIKIIKNALTKVSSLTGCEYDRIDKGTHEIGLIAQDVQRVIPEVVIESKNDERYLSINYGNMIALLIEAIKEQQIQINDLKMMRYKI